MEKVPFTLEKLSSGYLFFKGRELDLRHPEQLNFFALFGVDIQWLYFVMFDNKLLEVYPTLEEALNASRSSIDIAKKMLSTSSPAIFKVHPSKAINFKKGHLPPDNFDVKEEISYENETILIIVET